MAFFPAARLLSALALAAIVLPAAAHAESGYDTRVAVVSTRGMDLASPASQALLGHRIAVAAHKVCGQLTEGDAITSPAYAECFGRATADAKAEMARQIATANTRAMVASIATK